MNNKKSNYYIKRINDRKITLEEAMDIFGMQYKKSLNFSNKNCGIGLDLIDIVGNNHYMGKRKE